MTLTTPSPFKSLAAVAPPRASLIISCTSATLMLPFCLRSHVDSTWKFWAAGDAAAQMLLPPCVAWMEQVPMATSVTVEPDTEQTPGEAEAKLTARPEDAVALTANGAVPNGWF